MPKSAEVGLGHDYAVSHVLVRIPVTAHSHIGTKQYFDTEAKKVGVRSHNQSQGESHSQTCIWRDGAASVRPGENCGMG